MWQIKGEGPLREISGDYSRADLSRVLLLAYELCPDLFDLEQYFSASNGEVLLSASQLQAYLDQHD